MASSTQISLPHRFAKTSSNGPVNNASAAGNFPGIHGIAMLPAEVMADIMSYVLIHSKQPVQLRSSKQRRWLREVEDLKAGTQQSRSFRRSRMVDLLLVSQQFYFARIKAFYGENELFFPSLDHLAAFLAKIDVDRRTCVRKIVIGMEHEAAIHWFLDPAPLPDHPFVAMTALQQVTVLVEHVGNLKGRIEAKMRARWMTGEGRLSVR